MGKDYLGGRKSDSLRFLIAPHLTKGEPLGVRSPPTILHHGTTLQRARAIEANGPGPEYREPGTGSLPPAQGFSTVIGDGRPCASGTPELAARNKHALFPSEEGPAILEVSVPAWIMAILYADPIAAGLARSGEIRFEPESGLSELRAEWHTLPKRVIPL
jgi:hypothetical protein